MQQEAKLEVARLLATLLSCDRSVVYEINRDLEATGHIAHDGEIRHVAAYDRVRHLDPMRPAAFATRPEPLFVTGWNFDPDRLHRSTYFKNFMRPLGQVHKAELLFRDRAGRLVAGARISRHRVTGEFQDHEISLLKILHPVIQSHVNLLQIMGVRERSGLFARLSDREWQVVQAAASGLSNKEICSRLGTAIPTVKAQLGSAFKKLSVQSRAELMSLYHASSDDPLDS